MGGGGVVCGVFFLLFFFCLFFPFLFFFFLFFFPSFILRCDLGWALAPLGEPRMRAAGRVLRERHRFRGCSSDDGIGCLKILKIGANQPDPVFRGSPPGLTRNPIHDREYWNFRARLRSPGMTMVIASLALAMTFWLSCLAASPKQRPVIPQDQRAALWPGRRCTPPPGCAPLPQW